MTYGTSADQQFTDAFPRADEKRYYLARQTAAGAPATTEFQPLHFLTWTPTRTEPVNQVNEFGVTGNVDSPDPEFGDPTAAASETHRLCLNEEFYRLIPLLGLPTTTEPLPGVFQHIFRTGKSVLPLVTIRDTDSQSTRQSWGLAASSYALNVSRAGGVQDVSMSYQPREVEMAAAVPVDPANIRPVMDRLLVERKAFVVRVNGVEIGRVLDATLNYSTGIQTENYVGGGDTAHDAIFVGDPTLTVGFSVRMTSEAQREAFGGKDNPMSIQLSGVRSDGTLITFELDRVFGEPVFPTPDDKLMRLSFSGTAARSLTDGNRAMMRVRLRNTINPVDVTP
ncbi:phage tail tube protein [Litorimonas sp. WD9-15]|uniref:phage tail tube protein n=1 Tax=Litorimonas sp. WD9-15 TaxID=3418716 RepID=UPI003D0573C4